MSHRPHPRHTDVPPPAPQRYPRGRANNSVAEIVYEGPDGTVSEQIDDDRLSYREQHWQLAHGDDEYTYIPRERVYSVGMRDPHPVSE